MNVHWKLILTIIYWIIVYTSSGILLYRLIIKDITRKHFRRKDESNVK